MTNRSPKETVEYLYESLTSGDYETALSLLHPSYRSNTQPHETSPEALVAEVESIKKAITKTTRKTELKMEDGDLAVILNRVEGFDPDTGEPIAYRSADFFRVGDDGRLVEHWDVVTFDGADLFDAIEFENEKNGEK